MPVAPRPPKDAAALPAWAGELVVYLDKVLRQDAAPLVTVAYATLTGPVADRPRPVAGALLRLTGHPDGNASLLVGNGTSWDRYVASGAP